MGREIRKEEWPQNRIVLMQENPEARVRRGIAIVDDKFMQRVPEQLLDGRMLGEAWDIPIGEEGPVLRRRAISRFSVDVTRQWRSAFRDRRRGERLRTRITRILSHLSSSSFFSNFVE